MEATIHMEYGPEKSGVHRVEFFDGGKSVGVLHCTDILVARGDYGRERVRLSELLQHITYMQVMKEAMGKV